MNWDKMNSVVYFKLSNFEEKNTKTSMLSVVENCIFEPFRIENRRFNYVVRRKET